MRTGYRVILITILHKYAIKPPMCFQMIHFRYSYFNVLLVQIGDEQLRI